MSPPLLEAATESPLRCLRPVTMRTVPAILERVDLAVSCAPLPSRL
jgi:hypothetical protein